MSNVILTGAQTFAQNFGQQFIQSAGQIGLAYAGQAITNALDNRVFEGPRLQTLHLQSSRDGAPMARVYGRARIAGQVIWAARVKENTTEERQGSKGGGPTSRSYSYTLSFAVGLCQGEILDVGQIWANGQALQISGLNTRLYTGSETQAPDPLISEIEGGNVPGFHGTAYMVFEDMPIDDFGGRLPQLNFEIIRAPARTNDMPVLEDLVQGVDLIPATGEFAYATSITEERLGPGTSRAINMNNLSGRSDMDAALDQLQAQLPACRHVTLVVSWFGDDLRVGHCQLRPGVETRERIDKPGNWQVGTELRTTAYLISRLDDRPVYGGTPSDDSVIEAVQALKSRGFSVTLYPFILMDIPNDNALPDPYGNASQAAFAWRGRITCDPAPQTIGTVDKTSAATAQVQTFFGQCTPSDFSIQNGIVAYNGGDEKSYRRMVLHYAHLMQVAGGVDVFILGAEMVGLTTVRGAGNTYPSVSALKALANDVRGVLGSGTKLTYAADWSEYFGHHPNDGSGDVNFHLDPLWADTNIDAVGIDAYFPLSDWRDTDGHLDGLIYDSIYDSAYLSGNIEGGEGYDWYYASSADRENQTRTPITDGTAGKPWVFRYKDVKGWWANPHYNRVDGQELASPTPWAPQSKPIWFTEIGCPAIDKGANQPNVFTDVKSSESATPYYSTGNRDDLIQRRYLESFLGYWQDGNNKNPISTVYGAPMVDTRRAHIWCWDARPFPDFPARTDIWSDGENWRTGHWLSGRTGLISLADIVSDISIASGAEAPDVSRVLGMVSGYVLERPMSARAALSPLAQLYGFDLSEAATGLRFATRGVSGGTNSSTVAIKRDNLVYTEAQSTLTCTRQDAQTYLKDVRISFIDQTRDYQAGTVMARDNFAQTERIADVSAPVVLDAGQAKTIAVALLNQVQAENQTLSFALAPLHLGVEVGDVLTLEHEQFSNALWQITSLDGLGARTVQAKVISAPGVNLTSGVSPGVIGTPSWVSAPEGYALDIADFTGQGTRQGSLVGALVNPFVDTQITAPNGEGAALSSGVVIGALLSEMGVGAMGRFDYANTIDVYLAGVLLASISDQDVLAGGNMFGIETPKGWEIFQAAEADLIGVNTYRLSRLLRGQFGTDYVLGENVLPGARLVYLGQGWVDLPLNADLRGEDIEFAVTTLGRETSEPFTHTYQANHLRPFAPVHLKVHETAGNIELSWIRRTRIGGDDWNLVDVPLGEEVERYKVTFLDVAGVVVLERETEDPQLVLPTADLEAIFGSPISHVNVQISQYSMAYGWGAPVIVEDFRI